MRRFNVLLLLQLMAVVAFGQINLTGIVKGEGESLAGASVVIDNSYYGVSTGIDGNFELKNLKAGDYKLKVSFIGFESQMVEVSLSANKQIEITLKRSSVLTDEVLISATRAKANTPVVTTNLNKKDIESSSAGQDIPYLLGHTPSVVQSSESGTGIGYSGIRIRGTDPTRINVTINGIPLNDSESQGTFWVNMPDFANSVDNIQIQRGVGSSTNGAAAFGATINFQTETFNPKPYAEIQSMLGAFATKKNSVKLGTGLIDGKFSIDARYSKLNSDGFVDRAFVDHQSYFVSATYYTEKSMIKANIISGDQKTGISWWGNPKPEIDRKYNPAGEYTDEFGKTQYYKDQTDNYAQDHYQLFYSTQLNQYLNVNAALHYTKGEGFYEQYKEDESYADYRLPNVSIGGEVITETDLIRRKWLKNDFYGTTFSLNYTQDRVNASFGGAWNKYDGDHFGNVIWMRNAGKSEKEHEWYFNVGEKIDFNVFGKVSYQLSQKLNMYGDVQYRRINYDMSGADDDLESLEQSHDFNFFNPKYGLFYDITNQHKAFFSFSVGHREPTRTNFKEAKGDPSSYPKSETLYDFELGYKYSSTNAALGANAYYMYYNDQLVATGEKNNVGSSIMTNVDKSYRLGIELIGGLKFTEWLSWDANLTLSSNKIIDYVDNTSGAGGDGVNFKEMGDTDISYAPGIISSSIINITPFKNFGIKFISKYVGDQYFDNTSSENRKIDAYFVNDLRFDYQLEGFIFKNISLFSQINNILDAEYSNNAYGGHWYENGEDQTWAYYFPQAGINAMFGVTFKF